MRSTSKPTGSTPFAMAFCSVVDQIMSHSKLYPNPGGALNTDLKITLITDGEENSTISTDQCYGPDGKRTNEAEPWKVFDSWQQKVYNKGHTGRADAPPVPGIPSTIISNISYIFDDFVFALANDGHINFYNAQSKSSGGYFHIVHGPDQIPVPGDITGDYCVNMDDYNILFQAWGANGKYYLSGDLNNDRSVDFDDYASILQHWGQGHGCK